MSEINQSSQATVLRLPPSAWQVQLLRLTAFLNPETEINHSSWWLDAVGESPDTQVTEPKSGKRKEEGTFEGGKLVLTVQPGRTDWVLGVAEPEFENDEFPNIGFFPQRLEAFCELVSRWFAVETLPAIGRLAFGTILYLPVESREMGYRQLDAYLSSVQLDPIGSSDLVYQINRPRDSNSRVPELRINRLSKWSTSSFTPMAVRIDATSVDLGTPSFACCLQLDINTVQDFQGELDRAHVSEVWQELVDLGQEIIREGDIP